MNNYSTTNLNFPSPCPHCGKKNENKWCYEYTNEKGDLYGVCKREVEPAAGWERTDYQDADGTAKYRLIKERFVKEIRPKYEQSWTYQDLEGNPLVLVKRSDNGRGERYFSQWHYEGNKLVKGLGNLDRSQIPVYLYSLVRKAIRNGDSIWVVEGESCAVTLNQLFKGTGNFATTNLGGGGKWQDSDTECLSGAKQVIVCPDQDKPGKKHAEKVAEKLQAAGIPFQWCFPDPSNWEWKDLPDKGGFDVADWIRKGATTDQVLASVRTDSLWREQLPTVKSESPVSHSLKWDFEGSVDEDNSEPLVRLDSRKLYQYISTKFGKRLRFNELTKEVELDGEEFDLSYCYLDLAIDHGIKASKDIAIDVFLKAAKGNSYHPVRDYLEKAAKAYEKHAISIDDLSTRYFGTKNPLYDSFVKNTLIGAVARIFQPGCDMQNALVLQGKPGVRKSTFFKVLTGEDWFNDNFKDGSNADNLMVLHSHWIIEWGEIEKVLNKSKACDLKPFITCTKDNFRQPYDRRSHGIKRQQILVGSTNETEFLKDPTGNRRYWVIPVAVPAINIDQLKQERDQLWAAAVWAYRRGERWDLTPEQEKMAAENNERFTSSDVWDDVIAEYCEDKNQVTIREILSNALNIDISLQDRRGERRVSTYLTRTGWESTLVGKDRKRVWIRPNSTDERVIVTPEIDHDHPTITYHDHPENGLVERVSAGGDRDDRHFSGFVIENNLENFLPLKSEKSDRNGNGNGHHESDRNGNGNGHHESDRNGNGNGHHESDRNIPEDQSWEIGDIVEYDHPIWGKRQLDILEILRGVVKDTGEPWISCRLSDGSTCHSKNLKFVSKKLKWWEK
jgi:predicted P-loop ATPase